MKIAVVGTRGFPGIQGGIENHCEHLYSHLDQRGCDITVFTRRPYIDPHHDSYRGITLIPVSCPRNKFLETIVHTFKCVLKARALKPDILHIHGIGPSLFAVLARMIGMKVVVTHHGPDYMRKKWSKPAKIFLKFCERIGMNYANEIITIAKNIADDIKSKYGRVSTIIPNGVDIPAPCHVEDTLKRFGIEKQKYILSVGRFVPEKGFDDLIEAFNLGNHKDWKLVIVGDADHEDEYSRNLRAKTVGYENIVLTGFLQGQALHEIYSHAGLFVLASYFEGLPIVLLEAMSYGLSCIASSIPANRNVEIGDERFFEPGNVNHLATKMTEFIIAPWNETDRKGQIAMIAERYGWEKIANETFSVYHRIAAK